MSMVQFNDFNQYTNYEAGYDFSAFLGGAANPADVSSGSLLSDYASLKNGSYSKMMKAYYEKLDAEKASSKGDTPQKLTLIKSGADALKKSADALNDSSLWETKKIKKKDEETGEETEVEDYDWDAITKAVKTFIGDYNSLVEHLGSSDTKNLLRNAAWMTNITDKTQNLLSKIGISVGGGNKLKLDEEALKKADVTTLKSLFTGYGSFSDKIAQKAQNISQEAANAASRTKGIIYTKNGAYSDALSRLFTSTVDEKIGKKKEDENSGFSSKTSDQSESTYKFNQNN